MITRKHGDNEACPHDVGPHNYIMLAEGFQMPDMDDIYATMFCTKCADLVIVSIIPGVAMMAFGEKQ